MIDVVDHFVSSMLMLRMEIFDIMSMPVFEVVVADAHLDNLGLCFTHSLKDSDGVLLLPWMTNDMEEAIGSGDHLGAFRGDGEAGVCGMEDGVEVGGIVADEG